MARRRRKVADLIEPYGAELSRAFLTAIANIRSQAELKRITEALERGDIDAALIAVHLDPAVFAGTRESLARSFNAGGNVGASNYPDRDPEGVRLVVRFDAANPEAEEWLRRYSSQQIREIVDDQRTMIRTALSEGLQRGDNPRTVALDLVGRVDPRTGRRTGGLIGLSSNQEQFVRNARNELSSIDTMEHYFTRKMRDKRLDPMVRNAIREGRVLTSDEMNRVIGRYSDRLLKLRGDTIGRTEAMASLHRGQFEAYRQGVERGILLAEEIKREWDSSGDARVRESHAEMDGQQVGLNEPFLTPDGIQLMFPGDPAGPPEEIINCRCTETVRIDFLSRVGRQV